jgi:hypothetical protein
MGLEGFECRNHEIIIGGVGVPKSWDGRGLSGEIMRLEGFESQNHWPH